MPAYATGDDLIARFDVDLVGDLSTDEREPQSAGDVPTNSKVLTALEDASGEIDVALLAGGRYSAEQLEGLAGNSLAYLKRITCGLAIALLFQRRPEAADREHIEMLTKEAREAIRLLKGGANVFGLQEHIEAGQVDTGGPTALDLEARRDVTIRMGRYFPGPQTRLPSSR